MPHRYLAIEGNIGAGKTTLCKMLERDYQARLVLEEFSENPFLQNFYDNAERYALPVELFFLTERHKQMQEQSTKDDASQPLLVSDYYFYKTLLFAKNNLNTEEYKLFQRLFHILNASFPKPDLLVYLHRPVEQLLTNIHRRGRSYELNMRADYLRSIQEAYLQFFHNHTSIPVLVLEAQDADFQREPLHYQRIRQLLDVQYEAGLHYRSILG